MASARRGVWEIRTAKIEKVIGALDAYLSSDTMGDAGFPDCDESWKEELRDFSFELDCVEMVDTGDRGGF